MVGLAKGQKPMSKCIDGCVMTVQVTALMKVLPRKRGQTIRRMMKYERILALMRRLGLRQPLIVYPQKRKAGKDVLVDGQMYWEGAANEYQCLIATDGGEPDVEIWRGGEGKRWNGRTWLKIS